MMYKKGSSIGHLKPIELRKWGCGCPKVLIPYCAYIGDILGVEETLNGKLVKEAS
jgi:hypothetical protein